uniref:PGG domain-containing protein n=1 Tax=Aegilops tauschii subsp. strangulata TaxID=200361 RepID=A0A453A8P2_AEGTS
MRKYVLMLATLVATVAYGVGFSPPGGIWQENAAGHLAGEPIVRSTNNLRYLFVSGDSREMYFNRGSNDQREEMNLGTSRAQQQLLDVGEEERLRLDAVAGGGDKGGGGGLSIGFKF